MRYHCTVQTIINFVSYRAESIITGLLCWAALNSTDDSAVYNWERPRGALKNKNNKNN